MRAGSALLLALAGLAGAAGLARASATTAQSLFEQGVVARSTGAGELALAAFRAAFEADPEGPLAPDALLFGGETAERLTRDFDVATSLYGALVERFPASRHVGRAHERLAFLDAARRSGDEPLRRYHEVLAGYASLGPDEALRRMHALAAEHPRFVLAPAVASWIADEHFRRAEWPDALAWYERVRATWPGTSEAAQASKGVGDVAMQRARWGAALEAYHSIPVGSDGLAAPLVAALVRTAEEQRARSWLARGTAAYVAGLLCWLAFRTDWSRVAAGLERRPSRELALLVPGLLVLLAAARGEHPIVTRSLAWASVCFVVLALLNAAELETHRPTPRGSALAARAVALAIAGGGILYASCYLNGLHLLLEETLRRGPG